MHKKTFRLCCRRAKLRAEIEAEILMKQQKQQQQQDKQAHTVPASHDNTLLHADIQEQAQQVCLKTKSSVTTTVSINRINETLVDFIRGPYPNGSKLNLGLMPVKLV